VRYATRPTTCRDALGSVATLTLFVTLPSDDS
jgi:hypothetical protein